MSKAVRTSNRRKQKHEKDPSSIADSNASRSSFSDLPRAPPSLFPSLSVSLILFLPCARTGIPARGSLEILLQTDELESGVAFPPDARNASPATCEFFWKPVPVSVLCYPL